VSLFDVADAERPRELATQVYGSTGSRSALDDSRQGLAMLTLGTTVRVSLPLFLVDANFANPRDRLQRLQVDLVNGTLTSKALIAPPVPRYAGQLGEQRSVLIADDVIWLYDGRISSHAW
jgi:hypothetical protein